MKKSGRESHGSSTCRPPVLQHQTHNTAFYQCFWNKHDCHAANTPGVHYPTEIFLSSATLWRLSKRSARERFTRRESVRLSSASQRFGSAWTSVWASSCLYDGVRRDTLFSFWPPPPSQIPHQSIWFMFVWLSLDHSCFSNSCCWLFWGPDGFITVLYVSFMGRVWWGSPSLYVDPLRLVSSDEALVIYALQASQRKMQPELRHGGQRLEPNLLTSGLCSFASTLSL